MAAKTIDVDRLAAKGVGPVAAPTHPRRRRPAGDGSVYWTDDGRWRGVVDLGWVDGKRERKYCSGPTQAEALGKLRQAQREAEAGVISDDRMTVGRFLARWSTVNLPGQVSGTILTTPRTRSASASWYRSPTSGMVEKDKAEMVRLGAGTFAARLSQSSLSVSVATILADGRSLIPEDRGVPGVAAQKQLPGSERWLMARDRGANRHGVCDWNCYGAGQQVSDCVRALGGRQCRTR